MIDISNKIEFENNCWISLVDTSNWNSSEEARIKAVTDIASITTGRLGWEPLEGLGNKEVVKGEDVNWTRRKSLYERLLTESAGKPSTPFEFIPVELGIPDAIAPFNLKKYSTEHEDDEEVLLTNLRAIINYPKYRTTTYNEDYQVKTFKVIVGEVPWKVISHLRTHRAFSWLVESSRNKKYLNNVQFWYPSWWDSETKYYFKSYDKGLVETLQASWVDNKLIKPEEATMELSDRRLVKFAMAAWLENKDAWDNLFAVRSAKTGTMSITGIVVETIKKLIYA